MDKQTEGHNGTKKAFTTLLACALGKPTAKYLGFALLMAWHYALWFVPHAFLQVHLLDERVTVAWLVNLGATVFFLFLIAAVLGRKRHLSKYRWLFVAVPVLLCIGSFMLCLVAFPLPSPTLAYVVSFLMGPCEAALWVLWGERYACVKANFSIRHIGTSFGTVVLSCVVLTWMLPEVVASVFCSLLPLLSGGLLLLARRDGVHSFPPLLPRQAARGGFKSMVVVSAISFVASIACYFLAAIIPWEILPTSDVSFTFGILGGAVLVLAIAGIGWASKGKMNIFRLYPWLLAFEIIAFSLFLADRALYFPAFIVALGISSVFEILLIMYFGILTSKGYTPPALAFGVSGGCVRAGIALGNTLAVCYENAPDLAAAITPETCLAFICVLAALLIPLVRQEYNILTLTAAPPSKAEIDEICDEVSREFALSAREGEILELIARGYTTNSIATKLVISPYTVNTHIRHIYEKMQIHKRSELLNYLNLQRS
ncbi:response regulator transcription factor, partial [Gordonibacter sp.]